MDKRVTFTSVEMQGEIYSRESVFSKSVERVESHSPFVLRLL